MEKKNREHIVFDQMLKPKKNIPFSKVNKQKTKKQMVNSIEAYLKNDGFAF